MLHITCIACYFTCYSCYMHCVCYHAYNMHFTPTACCPNMPTHVYNIHVTDACNSACYMHKSSYREMSQYGVRYCLDVCVILSRSDMQPSWIVGAVSAALVSRLFIVTFDLSGGRSGETWLCWLGFGGAQKNPLYLPPPTTRWQHKVGGYLCKGSVRLLSFALDCQLCLEFTVCGLTNWCRESSLDFCPNLWV